MKQLFFLLMMIFGFGLTAQKQIEPDTVALTLSTVRTVSGVKQTTLNIKELYGNVVIEKSEPLNKEGVLKRIEEIERDTTNQKQMLQQYNQMGEQLILERRRVLNSIKVSERLLTRLRNILDQL